MISVTGDALVALIPQKPPFVLISRLILVSEDICITAFSFNATHVLCNNGILTPAGLIENIAQTCAAKVGYEYGLRGKQFPIGFIGDLKDFWFSTLPAVGDEITTEIKIETQVFDVSIISGIIKLAGKEIARCKMKVYSQPETPSVP